MTIFQLSGVHTKHHKNTASMAPVRMPAPPMITVPMRMHIGAPAVPSIQDGAQVQKGDLIATAGEGLSIAQHASIDGKAYIDGNKIIIYKD